MSVLAGNNVCESANAPGTGDFYLQGQVPGCVPWAAYIADGAQLYYFVADADKKEWGIGTLHYGAPNRISRETMMGNSVGTETFLDFGGAVLVYSEVPAERLIAATFDNSTASMSSRRLIDLAGGVAGADAVNIAQLNAAVGGVAATNAAAVNSEASARATAITSAIGTEVGARNTAISAAVTAAINGNTTAWQAADAAILAKFGAGLGTGGYQALSSGLLLQWGRGSTATGSGDQVNFITPFSAVYVILAFERNPGSQPTVYECKEIGNDKFGLYAWVITSTGPAVTGAGYDFSWIAIGHVASP